MQATSVPNTIGCVPFFRLDFMEKIIEPQLIPRKSKSNAQTAKNTGRQLENTQSEK